MKMTVSIISHWDFVFNMTYQTTLLDGKEANQISKTYAFKVKTDMQGTQEHILHQITAAIPNSNRVFVCGAGH